VSISGVYAHLVGTAGVTALVGKRVHHLALPQNCSYPAIVIQQISGGRVGSMGSVGGSGDAHPIIQITSWGTTITSAKTVCDAVRVTTDGFSGSMGSTTVKAVILQNEIDTEDYDVKSDRRYFGVIQEYEIWHTESTS